MCVYIGGGVVAARGGEAPFGVVAVGGKWCVGICHCWFLRRFEEEESL